MIKSSLKSQGKILAVIVSRGLKFFLLICMETQIIDAYTEISCPSGFFFLDFFFFLLGIPFLAPKEIFSLRDL